MSTMRAMTVRMLLLAMAILAGWWASRAAATSGVARSDLPVASELDDGGLRRLLEDVQRRAVELDRREREVIERGAALESLEEVVAESLRDLQTRDHAPGTPACRLRGGVTRIYESMRPEEAARILDQLDDGTLRVIFARMDAKQIGAIMAAMSRERAVAFTKTLAADPEPVETADR